MTQAALRGLLGTLLAAGLSACGGGGGGSDPITVQPLPANPVSALSPVAAGCTGGSTSGSFAVNSEVEPFIAIDPTNARHLVATWQQDRWTNGGARAIVTAASFDGGASWTRVLQPMSRCGGGSAATGGDYERVSDPWVDIGADGTVHLMGLAFSGSAGTSGANAMLASRSTDGGLTWTAPATLIADGPGGFNDKNTLTADPTDARYVYAVWDRLVAGAGPTWLARSIDGGLTWEAARPIYDPGPASQTIGNRIAVIIDGPKRGMLVNVFTQIDIVGGQARNSLRLMRSTDKGQTWSPPQLVAETRAVGTRDADDGTPIRDGSILPTIAAGPGGLVWVAWQDSGFSGGVRDAIYVARSFDGGNLWNIPVAVNGDLQVAAFTPALAVRADGTVGLTHYDLRADRPGATLARAWLLTSRDGMAWTESALWSAFDLASTPRVDAGLFLGDYQGLVANATQFLPLLAMSSSQAANPSDIFLLTGDGVAGAQRTHLARVSHGVPAIGEQALRQRVHENTVRSMERRLPGWSRRMGVAGVPPGP
ncbi:MAG TPA: sialidase family protein [Burkholderiaceae bacterium]|nr:sialidase family protein [Burkholderiaceae bacterium]